MIYTEYAPRALIIIPNLQTDMHTRTHNTTPMPRSLFTADSRNTAAQRSLLFLPLCHWVLCSYSHYCTAQPGAHSCSIWTGARRCLLRGERRNIKHDSTTVSCRAGASTFSLYPIQRESSRKKKNPLHWTFRDDFTDTERGSRTMTWAEVASLVAEMKVESSRSLWYEKWTPTAPPIRMHGVKQLFPHLRPFRLPSWFANLTSLHITLHGLHQQPEPFTEAGRREEGILKAASLYISR